MPERKPLTVSVIVKAYNEERHIGACIESALAAIAGLDGEVILADGASTDRTIAVAKNYPIKIVRLDDAADRSCGAGAQLGFQYSGGEFLCLIDGDMRLHREFLETAIPYLRANPTLGGVGGAVVNHDAEGLEYAQRLRRHDPDRVPGPVSRLAGSGLYRRTAISALGYLTDRNLHGGEELELAVRLQAAGWTLARIDCAAVDHYCRRESPYRLLLQRIKSRNACGPGELIRSATGQPQFRFVIRHDRNSRLCGLVALWWAALVATAALTPGFDAVPASVALFVLPFALMALRWRSPRHGLYSVAVWNAQALCFLPGFFRWRKPPAHWIASTLLKETPSAAGRKVRARNNAAMGGGAGSGLHT